MSVCAHGLLWGISGTLHALGRLWGLWGRASCKELQRWTLGFDCFFRPPPQSL